jgi:hypothetical protein
MNLCATEKCPRIAKAKGLCKSCYSKLYFQTHREQHRKRGRAWEKKNKKQILANRREKYAADPALRQRRYAREKASRLAHPERLSVKGHYDCIHANERCPTYVGMPFFDGWSPKTGGSYEAGAQWIINNLGPRPGTGKEYHLHIVDRAIGFMPGNLQWVPRERHKQEEMINKLLLENQHLKEMLKLGEVGH